MQIIFDIFNLFFFGPTVNLLAAILQGLQLINFPGSFGVAIILLTIVVRFLVWPFMGAQLKSAKKMADLKPHLNALKAKHKGDKQAMAAAQMALYKEHGVNPAAGCLPTLIQFPILIALYQTIFAFFSGAEGLERINDALYFPWLHFNSTPDLVFFGLNLAAKPTLGVMLLIPLFTAGLTFLQSKMMVPKPLKEYPSDSPKEKKEKEGTEDAMAAMQSQMMYMMPVMIGFFAFQLPSGLALYWNTLTIMGIVQQYIISGWGGLENWVRLIKK